MPAYGTLTLQDLQAQTSGTVAQLDATEVWSVFQRNLDAHNLQMLELVDTFCEVTTERLIGTGGVATGDFEELDEYETPRPQKFAPGENLGIPMRLYGFGQQWTDLWLEESTPADVAGEFLGVLDADRRNIIGRINEAIYLSANYDSIDIRKKDQAKLPIKRLANADGFSIPPGPNGESFTAATHTHYLARAGGTVAASDLDALITAVAEHYAGRVIVAIPQASETAVRAFTGFTATVDARIIQANTTAYAREPLVIDNRGDRLIGYYNGAEIWVKAWAITSYWLAWNTGAPKVCRFRVRTAAVDNPRTGLRPLYQQKGYPLNNRGWGREFGVGCTGRVSAAVLYTGGTTYADPTISKPY